MLFFFLVQGFFYVLEVSQVSFLCGVRTKPSKLSNFCVFVSHPAALSFPRAEICIWKSKYFLSAIS